MIAPVRKILPILMFLGFAFPAAAQFTFAGCDTVRASDFKVDTLVRGPSADPLTKEPLKMAFDKDAQGNVDVYFVQRFGLVRKYVGATRSTVTIANFNFSTGTSVTDSTQICAGCVSTGSSGSATFSSSEGLMAIALDPGFKTNGWIYLYVTVKSVWRVTRYKLTGNVLDLNSGKTIIRFTHPAFSQHMGGALRFDGEGNLWMTVSDNGSTGNTTSPFLPDIRYQAANTNTYFGKILRIKPKPLADNAPAPAPGIDSTYTVPAGNLFPRGTEKTLPEIYVMGNRNPYTLAIDSVRKGIAWGEVGPDNFSNNSTNPAQQTEEYNFTRQPGNFGWPFWAGNYKAPGDPIGGIRPPTSDTSIGSTRAAPINNRSDNTGLANLPPARPALIAYGKACAITGPVYYYDPNLNSAVKFPPHFHGTWFVGDFNNNWIDAVALNAAGDSVLARKKLFNGGTTAGYLLRVPVIPASNGLLEMDMGPDGALYVMNYAGYRTTSANTGIVRIEYRGTCRPTVVPVGFGAALRAPTIRMNGAMVTISHGGAHRLEVRDPAGRLIWSRRGRGPAVYDVDEMPSSGLRILTVVVPGERFTRKLMP